MGDKNINNDIKRIKLIDPNDFTNQYNGGIFSDNKFNMSVPPEDLSIIVELSTYAKGRTLLVSSKNNSSTNVTNEKININFNNNEIINLMTFTSDATTANKPNLTTKYTELSTSLDTIDESLGLTSIDIDFNSSYTPMVTINFVDIRGGAIFQQDGQSKYNVFFTLPYPLFQLKIKGYYGKPVIYCLHLTKFNSRFNSQTGNFEITTHFVGYTYALLSDMIVGLIKAAEETPRGIDILKNINSSKKSGSPNILSINQFLQAIPLIDQAIKDQLTNSNQNATTLSSYQQAETSLNNLINDVNKFIQNLKNNFSANLASDTSNNDIVAIGNIANVMNDVNKSVGDFNTTFQQELSIYNGITQNQNLNLINNLGAIITQFSTNDLKQPIANNVQTNIQKAYQRYGISDISQINSIVTRFNISIKNISSGNSQLMFIDVTDVLTALNNQLTSITSQQQILEKQIGQDLYQKIKTVLKFDPNIRNITNIFTTAIEIFLQLIYETATHWKDSTRLAQFSKFQNVNGEVNIDINKKNINKNIIFPFPEYHNINDEEEYLGKSGILTNPEQVPEIQLVDQLYDGMLIGNKILQDINNSVNGPSAWNSMNPIDSYLYQTTSPYERLPSSTGPKDLAAYVMMRAFGFLGFSNNYLSDDEIKAFATAEARNVITKFGNNFNIINGLYNNYKTITDYSGTIANINGKDTTIFINNNPCTYNYLNEGIPERWLLPTDKNFFGTSAIYSPNSKNSTINTEPSTYLLSSRVCDSPDLTAYTDNASYIYVVEKNLYENTKITSPSTYSQTTNAINYINLLKNAIVEKKVTTTSDYADVAIIEYKSVIDPKIIQNYGFNTINGKYGIQEFSSINYDGANGLGLNDIEPLYSLFYYNSNNPNALNLTSGRTNTVLGYWDIYNADNSINNFNVFYVRNKEHSKKFSITDLFKNQNNNGQNLPFFINNRQNQNNSDISFPFFGFSWETKNAENYNFQNLFGSRFYNAQTSNEAKAYLFLHCFPWNGLIGEEIADVNRGMFNLSSILNIFQYRSGFIQVPLLLPAFIGALIWRYEKGGLKTNNSSFTSLLTFEDYIYNILGKDPILFTDSSNSSLIYPNNIVQNPSDIILNNNNTIKNYNDIHYWSYTDSKKYNIPTTYQYCLFTGNKEASMPYSMRFGYGYGGNANIENIIINLPSPVKQTFLNEFLSFVNGTNNFNNSNGFPELKKIFEISVINQTSTTNNTNNGLLSFVPSNSSNLFSPENILTTNQLTSQTISNDANWIKAYNSISATTKNGMNNINNIVEFLSLNVSDYVVFSYFQDVPNNYVIEYKQNGNIDNTLKNLFFNYKYIANCSWRLWAANQFFDAEFDNYIVPCNLPVSISSTDLNTYISTFTAEIKGAKDENDKQYFNNKNLIEIKFEIYRTLKKIYDKWIANTDSPTKSTFQCCTKGSIGDNPTRLDGDTQMNIHLGGNGSSLNLIDSFRFINRAFVDIGDTLPINPVQFSKILADSSDSSFYDLFGRLLTDNNMLFVPLPTYIDYTNNDDVQNIFTPYPYYQAKTLPVSGPSFVCMYVGQTSTKLDLGPNSDYPNDGINLNDKSTIPSDLVSPIKDWETPTAAFLVNYGQQNQNIFKDIVLDQSEFTETNESLKITDAIANTYSQTSQSYVGQNLYNVYSARSYKAEVTMMGNAMIQPMMYFQLNNIPLFRGAYLIIGVKHHIVPNNMSTVFTGVRIKKTATPLIDAASLYTSLLDGYQLPKAGTSGINSNYTNYVFKYQDVLKQNLPVNKIIQRPSTNGPFSLENVPPTAPPPLTTNATNFITSVITPSANKPAQAIITPGFDPTKISDHAKIELDNWGGGTLQENSPTGIKYINQYNNKQGVYNFSQVTYNKPWSAVFVSYIMTFGDNNFPAASSHYSYATAALDSNNGYELFPLKAGLTIKVEIGDIMIMPRKGEYTASHGNIVWKIENNVASLIGGNRGMVPETSAINTLNTGTNAPDDSEGTVKSTLLTLNSDGTITDDTNTGLYLLIMKKTYQYYYKGRKFSIIASETAVGRGVYGGLVNYKITIPKYIQEEYIPALNRVINSKNPSLPNGSSAITKGISLLFQAQTKIEGFYPTSKAYKTNNPGNVGNTAPGIDPNSTQIFPTLDDGIRAQYVQIIEPALNGTSRHYSPLTTLFQYASVYQTGDPTSYTNAIINYFIHIGNVNITDTTTLLDISNIT